jgi:hypothetical protein
LQGIESYPFLFEAKSVAAVLAKVPLDFACLGVPEAGFAVSLAAAFWAFDIRSAFSVQGVF